MLNLWIGNLGKYNEGELVGDWLELPKSKAEIDKFLKEEVGLNDEYEEYMINDYETDLPIHIFEYEDINKLNILAEATKGITNTEAIEAFVEAEGEVSIEELINIALQKDDIPFYEYEVGNGPYNTLSNSEKYGMMKAGWTGVQDILEAHNIESYFDYEGYGYEDELSGYVDFYENGYLDRNAMNEVDTHLYSLKEASEILGMESEEETKKMKVVYKQVGKKPEVIEIESTLEEEQRLVGGLIEVVPYKDNLLLICNEEGKILNQKANLEFDYDTIMGDCFIVGDDYENADFKSLTDNQIVEVIEDLESRAIYETEEVEEDDMEF